MLQTGCAVVLSHESGPSAWGIAMEEDVPLAAGSCRRVRCPGLVLRMTSGWWGVGIGWYELLVFYAEADPDLRTEPVAFDERRHGADLGDSGLILGFARQFAVRPPPEGHFVQEIVYDEGHLTDAIVRRRPYP